MKSVILGFIWLAYLRYFLLIIPEMNRQKKYFYPSPLRQIHLNFFLKIFTSFPSPCKSSLGSFALFLMVFFITRWSIQQRLTEHEVGSIWEAIYQTEGARPHRSPPAIIICALVPAASNTPEPQMANDMFTEYATKRRDHCALYSPEEMLGGCRWSL